MRLLFLLLTPLLLFSSEFIGEQGVTKEVRIPGLSFHKDILHPIPGKAGAHLKQGKAI